MEESSLPSIEEAERNEEAAAEEDYDSDTSQASFTSATYGLQRTPSGGRLLNQPRYIIINLMVEILILVT